ncbi:phosphomannomutase [Tamilnaduibacter salinus]|uniref:phosphomannomutase n=1 Tax=Tamilnaduibacter salinus TaxID=1484056 RepID=A0A2A2I1X3_9GAMM|nr:phosphomannomutase/phosphoglucomutase [Tamilnaduibacter salinus]PAV25647.1 phosphomannomutase [Tamilnaduibacter salinus]
MTFRKKKAAEAGEESPAPKKKPSTGQKKSRSLRHLGSLALSQAGVVVLGGAAAIALVLFLVLQPAQKSQQSEREAMAADTLADRVNQRIAILRDLVSGYAAQPAVMASLRSGGEGDRMTPSSAGLLPQTRATFVFPDNRIRRDQPGDFQLSFVNVDLARRAERGKIVGPDAFPRDGTWFVQVAAPIRSGDDVAGTVLMVFEASVLRPALTHADAELDGRASIQQTVNGQTRAVIAAGSGQGESVSRDLSPSGWTLSYQSGGTVAPVAGPVAMALVIGVPLLVTAIVVWLLLNRAQSGLRRDVALLLQWSHKVFGGERAKMPTFRWEMVGSVGEALQRLSQAVDKRISRAEANARPAAAKGGKGKAAPAGGDSSATDEPLFSDSDMPDIDMLDGDDDVLGIGESDSGSGDLDVVESSAPSVSVAPEIFRAYDIRGIVGDTLNDNVVRAIGQAIGSEARARGVSDFCLGYDGRDSSPGLAAALGEGILSTGCNLIELGAVPTPVLYFATHEFHTGSGVMVTGSHNPPEYNGIKIMIGGDTLSGEAIQKLKTRIDAQDFESGQGERSQEDIRRTYLDRIVDDTAVAAPLRVVVDAGNGIAGELGPMLIEELGCEVIPLFCDVDGSFPNHHPDPGKPDNLQPLIDKVAETKADIGIAFDGDGDRLGVVSNTGRIVWPDRLMMLFARDVVSRNPGADVLYDVKCTRRLAGVISEAGGRPIMWKTGHSLMKAKMRETGALLAGEMSGHIFFKERWYGFDDGLYSAARLLEILGIEDRDSDEVFAEFPEDISTPELNVPVSEDTKFGIVETLSESGDFGDGSVSGIDGVRADYPDGWGLCRASNTTPVLVLRFEAETDEALARIQGVFREQLQKAAPDIAVDF